MAEKSPNNQQFRQGILAAALIVIIIGGSIGLGSGGSTFGGDPCGTPLVRLCGTVACQNVVGADFCTKVVSFSTPFLSVPDIKVNPITGTAPTSFWNLGEVKFFGSPTSSIILSDDEAQTTDTIHNADTGEKIFSLTANSFSNILVESEGSIAFTALSTNQLVNIKIKVGGVQIGQTMVVDGAVGVNSRIPFAIKAGTTQIASATITLTVGAAANDLNTNILLNSFRIYGYTNGWTGFPAGTTELFGNSNNEHIVDMRVTSAFRLIVDCPVASISPSSYLTIQYSINNGATWDFLDTVGGASSKVVIDGFGNTIGNCGLGGSNNLLESIGGNIGNYSNINANLKNTSPNLSQVYLRIVGVGGTGVISDAPVFSMIAVDFITTGIINPNIDVLSTGLVVQGFSTTKTGFTYRVNFVGSLYAFNGANLQINITSTWQATI